MKPMSYKRVLAYLIDVLLVSFIGVLIGYLIPVSSEYEKADTELRDALSDYSNKKIDDETYLEKLNDVSYTISKESVTLSIITVVIYIIYFVVVPYYYNGQTFGKKIMKMKIVSNQNKKLSMNNYLIRALIIDSILSNIIGVVTVLFLTKSAYIASSNIVSNIFMYLYIVIFAMILFQKDGRGFHDIIAGTKVVMVDDNGDVVPEAEVVNEKKDEPKEIETVKEVKKEETKKETKPKTTKAKSTKTPTKKTSTKSKPKTTNTKKN